eukprot:c19859_g1_i1.p1 GENE.c19859_g1_i1~~c19859_g1_i1.p1  ORF type:complete len:474 (-),score=85.72 c19859_g1_i1:400-1821(-)
MARPNTSPTPSLNLPEPRNHRRVSLFHMCDPHTQGAIIEMKKALEAMHKLPSRAPELTAADHHIKQALDILLQSGDSSATIQQNSTTFHDRLHLSSQLSQEVSEWLSMTYSPRRPPTLNIDQHSIQRQLSIVASSPFDNDEVRKELSRAMDWDTFDVFALDAASGGHALSALAVYLFEYFDLFNLLKLSQRCVRNFWSQIESGYRNVPYHSQVHAADVLSVLAWYINLPALKSLLKPIEICACLVAAGIHDHEHPGLNNDFMIKSGHELALRYNDRSVLENHHVSSGLVILQQPENNFLAHMDRLMYIDFRQLVISMVLSTDMSNHFQLQARFATEFESSMQEHTLTCKDTAARQLLLEQLLHCADLSNTGKPFPLAEKWGTKVVTEFYNQGDREKEFGLPVAPMNRRAPNGLEQSQIAFIEHIVTPMYEILVDLLPEMQVPLDHSRNNVQLWRERVERNNRLNNNEPSGAAQ